MAERRKGLLAMIMQGFVLLTILATLGIAIAILITTLNVQKQQKAPIVVYNGTGSTIGNQNALQVALNVPPPKEIQSGSRQYSSYLSVVSLLKQGLNSSVSPCDDFYTYTCGAWKDPIGFYTSDTDNYNKMVTQMQNTSYVQSAPLPVQQTVKFFNQCIYAQNNWNTLTANGTQITNALNTLNAGDGSSVAPNTYPFPMWDQKSVKNFPNDIGMGYLFGRPQGEWGNVITPVSGGVDTNWVDSQGQKGYAMFIDQPSTMMPYTYYIKSWSTTQQNLINEVIATMNAYATTQNRKLLQNKLASDAADLVNFDYILAMNFSTDSTTRRKYARSYNPMTIDQLQATYKNINWPEFIKFLMTADPAAATQILNNTNYQYIVMEPSKLQILNDALVANNKNGINPNTLLNYVFYSAVRSQSSYLPRVASTYDHINGMKEAAKEEKKRRRRSGVVSKTHTIGLEDLADPTVINQQCAAQTMEYLQWANARIFIDNIYPTQDSRDSMRTHVAKVASSILIGFRSMIDQLNWMSIYTKKGAYNKIENLVKNIAYPDWITDNDQLTAYYSSLGFADSDSYFDMVNKANSFNLDMMWSLLVKNGPADRTDFNGPPGTTNAWYQPEVNSITFPAGILHQPFYDANWPASVNFGAMGVIAGHELTHGFDDEGVQWDGVGVLKSWMDAYSQGSFNTMADCVVKEYSNFCPLQNTTYGAQCVDGAQTQGENIADNGGIHAAFRAYKNYINLNGPDPLLPDGTLQGFTADQLFFLGFAQVWCQAPSSNDALERQLLVDPHSPSNYRVFGTIQNFPAFKDAFNCPSSKYAPDQHCNVWVSDISSSYGVPAKDPNSLNVVDPQPAKQGSSQFTNYQSVVQLFKQGMNTQADPCNDFYSYTCGAWNSPDMSFDVSDNDNFNKMAQQMTDPNYIQSTADITPIWQVIKYFNECVIAGQNLPDLLQSGSQPALAVNTLMGGDTSEDGHRQNVTNTTWPMYDQTSSYTTLPDNLTMGYLLGQPTGYFGISTLITAYVDTNWVDPQGPKGYSYYIDQPTTMLPNTYYHKIWDQERGSLISTVVSTMNLYAKTQGKVLDQSKLQRDAADIVNFDYVLAMNFSTDDTTRRNFARSFNPMTLDTINGVPGLQDTYPFILWHEFIPLSMHPSDDSKFTTLDCRPNGMCSSNYTFIVMEPDQLRKLSDLIGNIMNNNFGVTPNTVMNYIYYNQMASQASFLPWNLKNEEHVKAIKMHKEMEKPLPGSRRRNSGARKQKRKWAVENDGLADIQQSCAAETMGMLQYANARVFVDKIYPQQADRDNIRNNVAKVASSILIGFRSMIDQLSWMTPYTKKGAYSKIENLVKNIAYPDWITDDNLLTQYHATLGINVTDTYFDVYNKANTFNIYQMFEQLSMGSANRIDFNGPPGTTNAWYQPELNSITFPAAILRQPFYDVNWPASVNFGAMGVIAGHELTHGFDDQGVQWDGIGDLRGWMDSTSQASFNNMSSCVVNEYNGFCPLDKSQYGAGACVDGAQTQGENIADNGGIHAAFRAYKNYINLNGPDPQLPDGQLEGFTADQLFFMAFAQVWCQMPPSNAIMEHQLLVDVHSPSIYRVFGTIQNFVGFKDAFHCPANSAYAPDQHCNVWVSDISSSYGLPAKDASSLNVLQPQPAIKGSNQYSNYQSVIQLFNKGLQTTVNPCDDFYQYTCGAWSGASSFVGSDTDNYNKMVQQIQNQAYINSAPVPVQKTAALFNQCLMAEANWNNVTADGAQVTNALNAMNEGDGRPVDQGGIPPNAFPFPMWDQNSMMYNFPNPVELGYLCGRPQGEFGNVITPITAYVDTNWVNPQGQQGYALFIDQPTTLTSYTYYTKSWDSTKPDLIQSVVDTMNKYATTQGRTLDQYKLLSDATDLVNFDHMLAMNFSTDETTRRQYARSYNPMTISQLQKTYNNINWHEFIPFLMIAGSGDAMQILKNPNYQYIVMEPTKLQMLNDALVNNNTYGISPNTLMNYIFYSVVQSQSYFLPRDAATYDSINKMKTEVKHSRKRRRSGGIVPENRYFSYEELASQDVTNRRCAAQTMEYLQYANARIFIDNIYTPATRDVIRAQVAKVASSIVIGFRSMIDQLDWMTTSTKKGAYNKIDNLVKNVAYPDWITNDTQLTSYYSSLDFVEGDTYFNMVNKASVFNLDLMWNQLILVGPANRLDFLGPPGTTNAWYQPEINSITFPAGILHQPFYDPNWPAAVNFGAMGMIAGHELTHGFDDEGVQWDGVGRLKGWMDSTSQASFNNMSSCVVNEYNGFCPLDKSQYGAGACVDGAQTQGENIADNGGIHAAFRAYKNYINLNGPDPQLPDGILEGFTADQLFFLGFAQVWCQTPASNTSLERQILVDPHSPSNYRVFGTIQNFPAFKDAFHCPANTAYAPDKHCNVWVSDINSNIGLPPADSSNLNIRDPQPPAQGSSQYTSYQSVVQLFKQGMNTQADPCNDFYSYTCGAWNTAMSFDNSDDTNIEKMAYQMMNDTYYSSAPKSVKQCVDYFTACVSANTLGALDPYGGQARKAVGMLMAGDPTDNGARQAQTNSNPWPMNDQTSVIGTIPDALNMGYLLGYPTGTFGVETLVSAYVDTNWVNPQGSQGYSYFIDQPTTMLPRTYYVKAWDTYKNILINNVIVTMRLYASTQNRTLDMVKLTKDATELVSFDYLLAMNYSTDDTTRRNYTRSYNPMSISALKTTYPNIDWTEFLKLTMLPSSDAIKTTVGNTIYNYIVMEPAQLAKLNNDLKTFNPNVVLNYIYYSQMNSQSDFLPWSIREEIEQRNEILTARETAMKGKRRRTGIVPMKKRTRKIAEDISGIQFNCAAETMYQLQYANARVFIDNIYPTQDSRTTIRNNVAKLASSILIGFRSMIDQLDWMSAFTKKGAYSKIDNLVKNIAYPDWITVDSQLDAYHVTLGISSFDDYITVYNKASTFNLYQMWELLSQGSANRIDFNGPPGTTNAWYQPEMNSITFPAAILHQPFYDANWPASVNFGAMGVIAGHELTHGFDDEGVQWNGIGALDGWMDATSQTSFTSMASCVVNEYSGFCPLNKTVYGPGACVDGAQTQGENIADNGGIHAAFRAYKNYINLNGPDPQLPDGQLEGFTADQLFFMAFANVWCQLPPTDAGMNRQILVDPHSPSIYRVFGTIQNFPGFKDAFHCPANSAYAPDQHCNVWVSDISSSYGLPAVKQSDINVPVQPKAVQSDPATYNAYQQSVDFFKYSVNFTADPCSDFWSYSCGNYNKLVSFHLADASNLVLMAQQLTDPNYQTTIQGSTALTKEKQFFDACVALTGNSTNNNNTLVQQNYIQKKVDALKGKLGNLLFTAVLGGKNVQLPTPKAMADSLGYLSFTQMIDTLITPMVDTYWMDNSQGYQFFIDQNSAEKSKTYYAPAAWANIRAGYVSSTAAVFQIYCTEQGIKCPNSNDLKDRVGKILDFEQIIAYDYSTDDATRRQYTRSWNLMTVDKLNTNYNFVDWAEYLKQLPDVAVPKVTDPAYNISVMEPVMIAKLSTDIQDSNKFDPDTVVNYLYTRLLLDNAQYLPSYQAAMELMPVTENGEVIIGKKRKQRLPRRQLADISSIQTSCIDLANSLMQFANGRVFIDYLYPTQADRDFIRQHAGGVITNIINSFQGMLMQLDWMSSEDKTRALQKTLGINQNIAFPDWIANNTNLDAYYAPLMFDMTTDNYYTMWDKLIQFNIFLQYNQLTMTQTDRHDFLGQPGTVNAWYQPELNSITFPAGILVPPYYNALWPASVNYGGLGVVAGHELTHGFDDEGVQWGPTGNLKQWMNNQSSIDGFHSMAQCVIDEYSGFCPLNADKYSPNCVNGQQTQGENIADNGGIHAAFRAYRTHIQLNGPDPMLPDQMFGQFTHDQLFFLSFGQVWCEAYRGDDGEYRQLMVDPHSPSKYRVFGTIQNYPAFQTAFHCPANSPYSPDTHCRVWVPNVEN